MTTITYAGNGIVLCDASTGYQVRNVAFCDSPERAKEFAEAINKMINRNPIAFAWRGKGTDEKWNVCWDIRQAIDIDVLTFTEIKYLYE